jgi:thymidylate synthase (FAD)
VTLLDTMGDEFTPAEDARTSTNKGRLGPDKDSALQRRLLNDAHTSPFEGAIAKFELVVPIFVLRELDRHRTLKKSAESDETEPIELEVVTPEEGGRAWFARSEMSARYVVLPPDYFFPKVVRAQSRTNKQGESGEVPAAVAEEFLGRGRAITEAARALYDWAAANNIERGQARIFNTFNQYTKIRLTGSVKNWLDFLKLRLPGGVLRECRSAAEAVEALLLRHFPDVVKRWRRDVFEGVTLTGDEADALAFLMENPANAAGAHDQGGALFRIMEKLAKRNRPRAAAG